MRSIRVRAKNFVKTLDRLKGPLGFFQASDFDKICLAAAVCQLMAGRARVSGRRHV